MNDTAATANAPAPEPDYVGTLAQPNDTITPDAMPAASEPAVNQNDDDGGEPAKTSFIGEDKRNAFYERRRAIARGEQVGGAAVDPAAPFAGKEGDDEADDSLDEIVRTAREANGEQPARAPGQPPAPTQDAPKTYELKVNRNTYTATREQMLEMAGLTPDEAQGIPDASLVRAAQINEAARLRLVDTKNTQLSEAADRQPPAPHPEQGNDHAAGNQDLGAQGLSALSDTELLQKIQYGDEEEANAAFDEKMARANSRQRQTEQRGRVKQTVDEALKRFEQGNPDIVQDAEAMEFVTNFAVADFRSAMVKAGANPQMVSALSQENAAATYSEAVMKGFNLPPVDEILSKAEARTRQVLNKPKGAAPIPPLSQPAAPQPQPSAYDRRMAAKANLAQTPQRAGSQVQANQPPPTRENSRMTTLNQMRAARFQKPLGA